MKSLNIKISAGSCRVARELPVSYRMSSLPAVIDLVLPGFEKSYPRGTHKTLALDDEASELLFNRFVDTVTDACGKRYLPVCRLGDGEYELLLGAQPDDFRLDLGRRLRNKISRIKRLIKGGGINAFTHGHYHSGRYSRAECAALRERNLRSLRMLSELGILALFVNFVAEPFYEKYFPSLDRALIANQIRLKKSNYIPGYSVYALLVGRCRHQILKNRRVLVVNGATGEKRSQIIEGLFREGVSDVKWCPISDKRAMFDTIDIEQYVGNVDVAFIGAGLGKFNIIPQLQPLGVPCIDAGFVFETWANPDNRFKRVWCALDEDWAKIGSDPFSAGI